MLFEIERDAVFAGFFAAFASVFSKLALENDAKSLHSLLCALLDKELCDSVRTVIL